MKEILRVENLCVQLPLADGMLAVARDVSFSLFEGEILCCVGESGCGKTTTALALTGLLPEHSHVSFDRLVFDGEPARDARACTRWRGRGIANIFQEATAHLDPLFCVGAEVRETLTRTRGLEARAARDEARRLLERVGLRPAEDFERFYPHQLSGGMNQRVLVALALACAPRVLIADEPTTGLDQGLRRETAGLIRELAREEGWAVLWITHDVGLAEEIADRAVVMYAGRIVEEGRAEAVFKRPLHPYTQALLACRPGKESTGRLPSIPGEVPNFRALPSGCAFHPRCARRLEICDKDIPKTFCQPNGQRVRCYLLQNA